MFIRLTPDQFKATAAKLNAEYKLGIAGNEGSIHHSGCTVGYKYDGDALELTIKAKPFFISESFAESQILAFFASQPAS